MARISEHQALDRQLCFALYAASRAVTRAYAPLLEESGLTYPQYITMLAIWERPDEPVTVGELGRRLRLETSTLTPLLKRLEALDLVVRTRDHADERRVLVALTGAGRDLRVRLAGVPAAIAAASGLGLDEIADLRGRLVDLVHHLDTHATGAATLP